MPFFYLPFNIFLLLLKRAKLFGHVAKWSKATVCKTVIHGFKSHRDLIKKYMKKILFSGIQPTGELHLGNYLGALKQWVALQDKYKSIFSVVDYHSLTENFDPQAKRQQILNTVAEILAVGIDPKKSILFIQSQVGAHTELAWILNCLTPIGELERMTQYKDKSLRQKENINAGLFTYPILMAADILLYKTSVVPVGEDQLQHLELARTLARRFNQKFGYYFPEPQALIATGKRIMALNAPDKKMSKSLINSYIALSDSPEIIRKKIQSAVTDLGGQAKNQVSGGRNLLNLLNEFCTDQRIIAKFEADYKKGVLKYSELKPVLAEAIIKVLKPIQTRRAKLLADPKNLIKILSNGAQEAEVIAAKNLKEIKKLIGIL